MAFACDAHAIGRKTWLYEQLVVPPFPTGRDQDREQIQLHLAHRADTISLLAAGVLDLKLLELRFEIVQRFFPAITDTGREQKNQLSAESRTFGLEAARYFTTHDLHYGRLSAGLLQFSPTALTYLKLGLNNGIFDTEEQPWAHRLDGSFLLNLPSTVGTYQKGNVLVLRVETLARLATGMASVVRLGGFLSWTNRMIDMAGAPAGDYEFMLFSFGPQAEMDLGGSGKLRLAVNLRLFVDKQVLPTGAIVTPGLLPSIPDISIGWAQAL